MLSNPVISFFSTWLSFSKVSEYQTSSNPIVTYVQKLHIIIQNILSRNPLCTVAQKYLFSIFQLAEQSGDFISLKTIVVPWDLWLTDYKWFHCSYIAKVQAQRACISAVLIFKLLSMFCNSVFAGVYQICRLLCMEIRSSPCVMPHGTSPLNSVLPAPLQFARSCCNARRWGIACW